MKYRRVFSFATIFAVGIIVLRAGRIATAAASPQEQLRPRVIDI